MAEWSRRFRLFSMKTTIWDRRGTSVILWANSMDISLRSDLEKVVNDWVQSGRYHSMEEAVNEAIQLLKETEEGNLAWKCYCKKPRTAARLRK